MKINSASLLSAPAQSYLSSRKPISNLREAALCAPLVFPKPKGAALLGLRYEKACFKRVKRWLKNEAVVHNPWIRYSCGASHSFASPDIVAIDSNIVFECKLSWTEAAIVQVENYCVLCEKIFNKGFSPVIMCKYARGKIPSDIKIIVHPGEIEQSKLHLMIWTS